MVTVSLGKSQIDTHVIKELIRHYSVTELNTDRRRCWTAVTLLTCGKKKNPVLDP